MAASIPEDHRTAAAAEVEEPPSTVEKAIPAQSEEESPNENAAAPEAPAHNANEQWHNMVLQQQQEIAHYASLNGGPPNDNNAISSEQPPTPNTESPSILAATGVSANELHHHHHHLVSPETYTTTTAGTIPAAFSPFYSAEPASADAAPLKRPAQNNPDFAPPNSKRPKFKSSANEMQWDAMYARLHIYKQQHGDCLVPKRYVAEPKLGTWVETQRVQYKRLARATDPTTGVTTIIPNKRLTEERLQKLEAIGFAWSAKNMRKGSGTGATPARSVNSTKMLVTESIETGGNDDTSGTVLAAEAVRPFSPVVVLVDRSGNIAPKPPPPEKPGGSSSSSSSNNNNKNRLNDAQWDEMYQRLVVYKQSHGDCLVPRKYEQDPKLATWVETQRVLWNRDHKKNQILQKPPSLDDLPAPVAVSQATTDSWETTSAEDDAEVAATIFEAIDGGDATSAMVVAEAMANVASKALPRRLTAERKRKLDDLGFVWSLRTKRIEDHWDYMFRQLLEYKQEHGDCLVPSRYDRNLKLGKWVETQRYEYTKLRRSIEALETKSDHSDISVPTNKSGKPANPRLTEDRLRRLEAIGFEWKVKHKMKRYYDKQWDGMFARLLAYKEANGHCMVPKRYPADVKLGTWVHTQRIQYRKMMTGSKKNGVPTSVESMPEDPEMADAGKIEHRLTEERRQRLEAAGFVWAVKEGEKGGESGQITRNSYDDQWDSMFEKLEEYKKRHGDCLVPKRYKENPKLGTWVDTQRVQFKKLQKKLAQQGPSAESEATAPPPLAASAAGPNVGVSPKPLVGRLTDDRIRRLQQLGFVWSLRDDWQKHYGELKTFKNEYGHCNVPARYTKNRKLGIWVSAQRQQYKVRTSGQTRRSSPLTQDRIDLLNELGFTWTIRSRENFVDTWPQRMDELKEFYREHGHCMVPLNYEKNMDLGMWVDAIRTQYQTNLEANQRGAAPPMSLFLTDERIRELNELGMFTEQPGAAAYESYAVPYGDRKMPALGPVVHEQFFGEYSEETVAAAVAAAAVEAAEQAATDSAEACLDNGHGDNFMRSVVEHDMV